MNLLNVLLKGPISSITSPRDAGRQNHAKLAIPPSARARRRESWRAIQPRLREPCLLIVRFSTRDIYRGFFLLFSRVFEYVDMMGQVICAMIWDVTKS